MEVPIATVVTLAIALVSAGAVIGKLISVAERVKNLEKGATDQGKRIGNLETTLAVDRAIRKATRPNLPVPPNPTGKVTKAISDDESGGDEDE